MFTEWTSREKKLIVVICVLALLLLSMLVSSWHKSGYREPDRIQPSFEFMEQQTGDEFAIEHRNLEERVDRSSIDETELVMVDIKGAVQNPYVYTMQAEQRVIDVIHRAGGLLETASTDSINLAQKVYDGMVVYVPTEEEAESGLGWESLNANSIQHPAGHQSQVGFSSAKININTASAAELESLPGIGPSRAKAIITYREERGHFSTPEDIMNVSGIGSKIFANLKDKIDVR